MIVWLASYPRSGNTFFRVIIRHRYQINTFSVYDDPLLDRVGAADVVEHERLPASIEELDADERVYFVKTHEVPTDHHGPAICLVRDGRDSLVSFARYEESFSGGRAGVIERAKTWWAGGAFRRELHELVEGRSPYGSWADHTLAWRDRPDPTVLVRYEDLVDDPFGCVDRAFQAVGLHIDPVCTEPLPTFSDLHRQSPQFFRKGRRGSWQDEMPTDLHERFWHLQGHAMAALGYDRDECNVIKEAA